MYCHMILILAVSVFTQQIDEALLLKMESVTVGVEGMRMETTLWSHFLPIVNLHCLQQAVALALSTVVDVRANDLA